MQSDSRTLDRVVSKDVIAEIGSTCLLLRTRLISRVIAGIYEEKLQPFGIGAAQFASLVAIYQIEPATRAEIGRFLHQDRSTLTRNLKVILSAGWAVEIQGLADGRARPLVLTTAGKDLLRRAEPAWQAAQAQAKALLGKDGIIAVMEIANRIMDPKAYPLCGL
jgi:DNA-binding MarR family transcriptional regulator